MRKIDHYVILSKKKYRDDWMYVDGYKTLHTLRKRFNLMREVLESVPHGSTILCSRDENKNILKIYDEFK